MERASTGAGRGAERPTPLPFGLLAWLLAGVLGITLVPLDGSSGVALIPPTDPVEIVVNLLLFVPVAAVLAAALAAGQRSDGGAGRILVRVMGGVAVLSLGVELIQLGVPGRYPEPYDVILNTLGAGAAALAVARLRRAGFPSIGVTAAVAGLTYFAILAALIGSSTLALHLLRMEMWDRGFQVVVGDEPHGGRAFVGGIADARICAGVGEDRICALPGADSATRDRLSVIAEESQRLSLSAAVVSESNEQAGPARIVTFSRDSDYRNTTLAQDGRTLVLRVRTLLSGENGTPPAFYMADAVERDVPTTVSATYEPGRVVMRAETADGSVDTTFSAGLLAGWWLLHNAAFESRMFRIVSVIAALVLFLPVGYLGARLYRSWPRAVMVSVLVAAGGYAVLEALVGGPVRMSHVALAVGCALLGMPLGRFDRGRLGSPAPSRPVRAPAAGTRPAPPERELARGA